MNGHEIPEDYKEDRLTDYRARLLHIQLRGVGVGLG